jgi:hypothetical protein
MPKNNTLLFSTRDMLGVLPQTVFKRPRELETLCQGTSSTNDVHFQILNQPFEVAHITF